MQLLRIQAIFVTVLLSCAGNGNMVVLGSAPPMPMAVGNGYNNGHVGKKGISYPAPGPDEYLSNIRYGDPQSDSCNKQSDYEISQNYIIRTKDSKANGATFITPALVVRTFETCLEQCCLKENCDTTIFIQEVDPYDQTSEQPNCFLFECRPNGDTGPNHCLFTYHAGYISSIKKIHGGFQSPVMPVAQNHPVTSLPETEQLKLQPEVHLPLTTIKVPYPDESIYNNQDANHDENEIPSNCDQGDFECASGDCINALYICNSIPDCRDESDEYDCSPPSLVPGSQPSNGGNAAKPLSPLISSTNPPDDVILVKSNKHNELELHKAKDRIGASQKDKGDLNLADQLIDQSPVSDDKGGPSLGNQDNLDGKISKEGAELIDENRKQLLHPSLHQDLFSAGTNSINKNMQRNQDGLLDLHCSGAGCLMGTQDNPSNNDMANSRGHPANSIPSKAQVSNQQELVSNLAMGNDHLPPRPAVGNYDSDVEETVYDVEDVGNGQEAEDYGLSDGLQVGKQQNAAGNDKLFKDGKHVSETEGGQYPKDQKYNPGDTKIVSDHDMGMRHPADAGANDDAYYKQDLDVPGDKVDIMNWGYAGTHPEPVMSTEEPPRRVISHSNPKLNVPSPYISDDYYSYYFPVYGQQGRYKVQGKYNWPAYRNRQQNQYRGRNTQNGNPGRSYSDKDTSRHSSNVQRNQQHTKAPVDADQSHGKTRPTNDKTLDNTQPATDVLDNSEESAVTVIAPPHDQMTAKSKVVNVTVPVKSEANYATHSDDEFQSRGGGGMPPASSAILPLVIGLLITMCLLLMVGCRLRYMNQRLRYGRLKTSANDADYLINGMYL